MLWTTKMKAVLVLSAVTVLVCAVAAAWSYRRGYAIGSTVVQQRWDAERAATAQAHAEEIMKARQLERALREHADKLRRKHDEDLRKIARDHAALVDSLRERPSRSSAGGVPGPAAPAGGDPGSCIGSQLYREDGEFLAREAARADQLRIALRQCQAQYNALTATPVLPKPEEPRQ